MASLEHFDLLLGEALECLEAAAYEIRKIGLANQREFLLGIGNAVGGIWGVREKAYEIKPELKRDFVKEREENKARWEELHELHKKAGIAEENGQISEAIKLLDRLLTESHFGYFRLLAEAGLYRLSKMQEQK